MVATLEEAMSGREVNDDDINRLERGMMGTSAADILWGSPRGEGLVTTVARLSETVEKLSSTVTKLTNRVIGEDGIASQVRVLRDEVARTKRELIDQLQMAKAERDDQIFAAKTDVAERDKVNQRKINILIGLVSPLIPGFAWLLYRSIQIAMQGHL